MKTDIPETSTELERRSPSPGVSGSAPICEWWVYSTAIAPGWLMLYCAKTGATGTVRDPNRNEWNTAFYAPSHPYRWYDETRVVVDAKEPNGGSEPPPKL